MVISRKSLALPCSSPWLTKKTILSLYVPLFAFLKSAADIFNWLSVICILLENLLKTFAVYLCHLGRDFHRRG